jgi:Ribosomal protein L3
MSIGLVGRKCGMSRLFTEDGRSIPVTLIEATPNRVTQVKTDDNDGYSAVQVSAGSKRANLLTQPLKGHYAKAKVEPGRGLWEFRVSADDLGKYTVGARSRLTTCSPSARWSTLPACRKARVSRARSSAGTSRWVTHPR